VGVVAADAEVGQAAAVALLITTETAMVEEIVGQPGAIVAPGFGDLAEGMIRPSNIH
jgi:chaperonin GroEL